MELNANPPYYGSVGPKDDNLYHWVSNINGPPSPSFVVRFVAFIMVSLRKGNGKNEGSWVCP